MNQTRLFGMLVLSVALLACAPKPRDRVTTAGRDFDRTHVNDIKIGVHDKARIRDWFGEPYHMTETNVSAGKNPGCTGRWMYFYSIARSETNGSHMDVKTNQSSLIVGFDKKDKVCMSTYSEGAPSKDGAANKEKVKPAIPTAVAAETHALNDDRVSVKLGSEVAAAEEKVKAIKEHRIMERLQEELRNRMADLPRSSKAQIVITKLHLRSGSAVFFAGHATGDDFIYTDITITDKGKQTHHMVFESVNTASSRSQVPPRRVNNMIRKFGTQVSRELRSYRR